MALKICIDEFLKPKNIKNQFLSSLFLTENVSSKIIA